MPTALHSGSVRASHPAASGLNLGAPDLLSIEIFSVGQRKCCLEKRTAFEQKIYCVHLHSMALKSLTKVLRPYPVLTSKWLTELSTWRKNKETFQMKFVLPPWLPSTLRQLFFSCCKNAQKVFFYEKKLCSGLFLKNGAEFPRIFFSLF